MPHVLRQNWGTRARFSISGPTTSPPCARPSYIHHARVTYLHRRWPSNPAQPSLTRPPITSPLSNHKPCPSIARIDILASSLLPHPPPPQHGLSPPWPISHHTAAYPLSVVHRNWAPTATAATHHYYYYFYVLFYSILFYLLSITTKHICWSTS